MFFLYYVSNVNIYTVCVVCVHVCVRVRACIMHICKYLLASEILAIYIYIFLAIFLFLPAGVRNMSYIFFIYFLAIFLFYLPASEILAIFFFIYFLLYFFFTCWRQKY